jgi:glycosyltransferase involved in cell wall biosynthesis
MRQTMQPISVIVPTLNEADNLNLLFSRIDKALSSAAIPYEVIIIDDHSTDATVQIALQAADRYDVKVMTKRGQPGKAFSLLEGFDAAKYDLLCMIDADLQYPPEAITSMYHKLQFCEADIVITERIDNKTSPVRQLTSVVFKTLFTRMLFGINYDTQSGLKLFRKSVLKSISLSPSPWTFDLEFIVRALEQGYSIVSQPIKFSERNAGVPKVKLLSATLEIASGSYRLWRNTSSERVKSSYKHSERLQRSVIGTALLVAVAFISTTTFSPSASALDLTVSSPLIQTVAVVKTKVVAPVAAVTTPPEQTPSTVSSPPSPTPTANSTSAAPPLASEPVAPVSQPTSSSAATIPPESNTPTSKYPAAKSTAATTAASTSHSSGSTLDPRTLAATATSSNAKYYPDSALGNGLTHRLLRAAELIAVAGGFLIIVGIGLRALRSYIIKHDSRSPLKV